MGRRLVIVSLAVAGMFVAACSGGGSSTPTSTTSVSSSSSSTSVASSSTSEASPSTSAPVVATYPLTGVPVADEAAAKRPALVVKIDNNALARPQSNLNAADIVFEEIVEVQTRFAAVFQSQGTGVVGPIRSGRTQDVILLGSFNKPLFTWSGGNAFVTRVIANSDFVDLSAQFAAVYVGGGFHRDPNRGSPHNLYADLTKLWSLAPGGATPPPPQFQYLASGQADVGGTAASGTHGDMFGLAVQWTWDAASGKYGRKSAGVVHSDALNGPLTSENVLVLEVKYGTSAADVHSPEAQTVGNGTFQLYTRGNVYKGTWTRKDRVSTFALRLADGSPALLTPGRTFVELAHPSTFTPDP
jgi:hypothetical protein